MKARTVYGDGYLESRTVYGDGYSFHVSCLDNHVLFRPVHFLGEPVPAPFFSCDLDDLGLSLDQAIDALGMAYALCGYEDEESDPLPFADVAATFADVAGSLEWYGLE